MLTPHSLGIKSVLEQGLKNMNQATKQASLGDKRSAHYLYTLAGTMFRRAQSLATMVPEPGERATAMKGTTKALEEWASSGLENAPRLSGMSGVETAASKAQILFLAAGAIVLINVTRQQAKRLIPLALGGIAVWLLAKRQQETKPQAPPPTVFPSQEFSAIGPH